MALKATGMLVLKVGRISEALKATILSTPTTVDRILVALKSIVDRNVNSH